MNMKLKRMTAAVALALTLNAGQANAMVTAYVPALQPTISAMQASIAAAIAALGATITALVTAAVSQIHADLTQQNVVAKSIAEASIDAQNQYQMQQRTQELKERYHTDPNSSTDIQAITEACKIALGGSSLQQATIATQASTQAAAQDSVNRNMNTQVQSAVIARDVGTHNKLFCSNEDVANLRCSSAAPKELQNLDLQAKNIFTPSSGSYTYSKEELIAAKAYVQGTVNPFPTTALPKEWNNSPQGRTFQAAQMAQQRRLDLSSQVLSEIVASRESQAGLGTAVGMSTPDASPIAIMDYYAGSGFFFNPAWHSRLSTMNDTDLLQEQAKMLAFQNWLTYKTYLQGEHQEALLATQLAAVTKEQSDPQLAAQRQATAISMKRN